MDKGKHRSNAQTTKENIARPLKQQKETSLHRSNNKAKHVSTMQKQRKSVSAASKQKESMYAKVSASGAFKLSAPR
jgi:hypothetical protein